MFSAHVNYLNKTEYSKLVSDAVLFLSEKSKSIQKKLSEEMEKSSKKMDYEKAAVLRDRIKALTQIQSSQNISSANLDNADVISIVQEAGKSCVQVFFTDQNKIGVISLIFLHTINFIYLRKF